MGIGDFDETFVPHPIYQVEQLLNAEFDKMTLQGANQSVLTAVELNFISLIERVLAIDGNSIWLKIPRFDPAKNGAYIAANLDLYITHSDSLSPKIAKLIITLLSSNEEFEFEREKFQRPRFSILNLYHAKEQKFTPYVDVQYLGGGSTGMCRLMQNIETGTFYGIKIMWGPFVKDGEKEFELMEKMGEATGEILRRDSVTAKNSNGPKRISKIYGVISLASGITLSKYLSSAFPLNEHIILSLYLNILRELEKLHLSGYAHRDVSVDNIVVDPRNLKVKIIDLGGIINLGNYQGFLQELARLRATENNEPTNALSNKRYYYIEDLVTHFEDVMQSVSWTFDKKIANNQSTVSNHILYVNLGIFMNLFNESNPAHTIPTVQEAIEMLDNIKPNDEWVWSNTYTSKRTHDAMVEKGNTCSSQHIGHPVKKLRFI